MFGRCRAPPPRAARRVSPRRAHLPRPETADGDDTVVVQADGPTWTVRPQPDRVDVHTGTGGDVHAVVGADPVPLLRWLWQ